MKGMEFQLSDFMYFIIDGGEPAQPAHVIHEFHQFMKRGEGLAQLIHVFHEYHKLMNWGGPAPQLTHQIDNTVLFALNTPPPLLVKDRFREIVFSFFQNL